jgi:putative membrane protein
MEPANKPEPDPRVYLAIERTFLAWIRTGLALMGFGFIVARFGLFLHELREMRDQPAPESAGYSLYFGTALVLLGVTVNVAASIAHIRMVRRWNRGHPIARTPSALAVTMSLVLALVGAIMAGYLLIR